ncbi:MAG TPA: hypothetical protein VHB02_01705 [Acidimicrobiales bacterium]|nr:hypothetical protein [Acidimicrobiales bacterium]
MPVPTYRDQPATVAADLAGVDLSAAPVRVPVLGTGRWTLLLFLSSGCFGCRDMWDALADPVRAGLATDERVVAVTHGPDHEDVVALGRLAPGPTAGAGSGGAGPAEAGPAGAGSGRAGLGRTGSAGGTPAEDSPVVMSEAAWSAYRVQGPPFFVLVDGTADRVVTEGVAWGVGQVADHVRAARAARASQPPSNSGGPGGCGGCGPDSSGSPGSSDGSGVPAG